jgi:hypothetical protein
VHKIGRAGRGTAVVGAVALIATITAVTSGSAGAQEEPEVVASGLNNPRHVVIAPGGKIYVAEAGSGGGAECELEHPLGTFHLGFSGSITRVGRDGSVERVLTGLPSIIERNGVMPEGETLGPSDIAFKGSKDFVVSIGIGGSDAFRESCPDGELLGTLVSGRVGKDDVELFADVLAYEAAANPGGEDIDSNPVGLLRRGGAYVVADAGGNAIVRASHKGRFSTVAAIPRAFADADPVPTSVVRGPDGAFYVSQLTGFPFTQGVANIWRVVPGSAPTVYASGLTNVTDLAFARDGSLYAVEIASQGLLNGPIGSLVKIAPGGGSTHETVAGGLFAPYGVALTKDAAYVTTGAVLVGGGELIKIPLD